MFDIAILGAGPAGIGLLSSLYRLSQSANHKAVKICLIERADLGHAGSLRQYTISSDTRAEKFLTCLDGLPQSITANPTLKALTETLRSYGANAVPLPIAGEFFRVLGEQIIALTASESGLEFRPQTQVNSAQWHSDHWRLETRTGNAVKILQAKHFVMAGGAAEDEKRFDNFLEGYTLDTEQLKACHLSSEILKAGSESRVFNALKAATHPKVSIIGGSHSAVSCAAKLLVQNIAFEQAAITLFHRSPMYVTFDSAQDARRRGFTDFTDDDICPKTQRVYALKGFRLDSRELLLAIQGYDGGPLEKRVQLTSLKTAEPSEVKHALQSADLVISALGYSPNYSPLYRDDRQQEIALNDPNFVNDKSQLLDHTGVIIPNCYALGLASNYNLARRFGEPSFMGQANGLVLWHKDIGMDIASSLIRHLAGE